MLEQHEDAASPARWPVPLDRHLTRAPAPGLFTAGLFTAGMFTAGLFTAGLFTAGLFTAGPHRLVHG
eukprot:scaffold1669_cov108-Isochrysis_galbana.AAC.11